MCEQYFVNNERTQLYCRKFGQGKPVVLMHGACVDSDFFMNLAKCLSKHFCVIVYDRRGYSRSGSRTEDDFSIEEQAKDVALIIESVGEPCSVFAHSAATTIGVELMSRYPNLVTKLILYEPPIAECLPTGHKSLSVLTAIVEMIRNGKYQRALHLFMPLIGAADDRAPVDVMPNYYEKQNSIHFIKNEFYQVFYYQPDYSKISAADLYVCLGEQDMESHHAVIAKEFAKRSGKKVIYFPGRHNAPHDLPEEFAYMLSGILL